VFERYTHLLDVRRREAAFHPASAQQILDLNPAVFALRRHHAEKDETVVALHNVSGRRLTCILPSALARLGPFVDLLSSANGPVYTTPTVALAPYGVCWLKPLA
jgi:sucrose phosphorylase